MPDPRLLPALALALGVLVAPAAARAGGQRLSLREAVETALRSDPQLLGAVIGSRRADNTVLRAQLDRFSLRVDASLTEQWRAGNLGGPTDPDSCYGGISLRPLIGRDLIAPVALLGLTGAPSQTDCEAAGGIFTPGAGVQTGGIGLLNVSANLQVPLFSGFRVTANVERSKHLRESAVASVRQEQRRVALDVLRAYWAVRRAELQQQVSQTAIQRYDDSVSVVSARVRAGLAPPVDTNRIETRRQRELARLRDLEGASAESRAQLQVALGLPGGAPIELTEEALVPPSPPEDAAALDRMLSEARKDRPEMQFARRQLLAGKELVRLQQSAYYPQLAASALLQFGNNPFNPLIGARAVNDSANPFTNITGSAFVGATLSINLFDTLNTFTSVRDARYDEGRLAQEERRLGRLVEADVRVAHAHLVRLYRTREPLQRTRELAKDTLDIIEKRYKNGDALVLDYVDAQLDLLSAEIDLANSAASIAQTWGELQVATGRLPGQERVQ